MFKQLLLSFCLLFISQSYSIEPAQPEVLEPSTSEQVDPANQPNLNDQPSAIEVVNWFSKYTGKAYDTTHPAYGIPDQEKTKTPIDDLEADPAADIMINSLSLHDALTVKKGMENEFKRWWQDEDYLDAAEHFPRLLYGGYGVTIAAAAGALLLLTQSGKFFGNKINIIAKIAAIAPAIQAAITGKHTYDIRKEANDFYYYVALSHKIYDNFMKQLDTHIAYLQAHPELQIPDQGLYILGEDEDEIEYDEDASVKAQESTTNSGDSYYSYSYYQDELPASVIAQQLADQYNTTNSIDDDRFESILDDHINENRTHFESLLKDVKNMPLDEVIALKKELEESIAAAHARVQKGQLLLSQGIASGLGAILLGYMSYRTVRPKHTAADSGAQSYVLLSTCKSLTKALPFLISALTVAAGSFFTALIGHEYATHPVNRYLHKDGYFSFEQPQELIDACNDRIFELEHAKPNHVATRLNALKDKVLRAQNNVTMGSEEIN